MGDSERNYNGQDDQSVLDEPISSINGALSEMGDGEKYQNRENDQSALDERISPINRRLSEIDDDEKINQNMHDQQSDSARWVSPISRISNTDESEKNLHVYNHEPNVVAREGPLNRGLLETGNTELECNENNYDCASIGTSHLDGDKLIG